MTPTPLSIPAPPLQAGSLFEADFSMLEGVKPNVIILKQQYVTAPLVMLRLQPDGRLLPMVIQVRAPRCMSHTRVLSRDPGAQVLSPPLCPLL